MYYFHARFSTERDFTDKFYKSVIKELKNYCWFSIGFLESKLLYN